MSVAHGWWHRLTCDHAPPGAPHPPGHSRARYTPCHCHRVPPGLPLVHRPGAVHDAIPAPGILGRVWSQSMTWTPGLGLALGWNGCDHIRPPLTQHASEIPLLTPWSHPICSTRYKLDTGNRFQTRSPFSKYFYFPGMLCGKWGFDKSGNCVRVSTLLGSVSSDFLFDNNHLQSLSVLAPHLNYSPHKNISRNTQSIRNQHK